MHLNTFDQRGVVDTDNQTVESPFEVGDFRGPLVADGTPEAVRLLEERGGIAPTQCRAFKHIGRVEMMGI